MCTVCSSNARPTPALLSNRINQLLLDATHDATGRCKVEVSSANLNCNSGVESAEHGRGQLFQPALHQTGLACLAPDLLRVDLGPLQHHPASGWSAVCICYMTPQRLNMSTAAVILIMGCPSVELSCLQPHYQTGCVCEDSI